MINTVSRWSLLGQALFTLASCGLVSQGPVAIGPVPTLESLSGYGSFSIAAYTEFPDVAEFGNATIFYPTDSPRPVGGVAIVPGFTERQPPILWWGPRLASHGFAVVIFDTNELRDPPEVRAEALIAAVQFLKTENARATSPLFGKVDPERMAVMGHSMGGGGALIAANTLGDEIRAAIPFTPWQPDGSFGGITAPTLIIAGEDDTIARVGAHSWPHFESLPATTPRVYLEVAGGDHYVADSNRAEDLAMMGRYGVAWLKLYLDGDERYRDLIYGDIRRGDDEGFSRYVAYP